MKEAVLTQEAATKFANLLYGVAFFNIFTLEELISIVSEARLMKWKRFVSGARVFEEGVFDQHFYIILRGKIEVRKKVGSIKETSVGTINRGEVFGELVVTDPSKPRRASAYVVSKNPLIVCEIDGTLVDTVPIDLRVKFLKKFLDLILQRIDVDARKIYYYQDIIEYAAENGMPGKNRYFMYSIETAINEKNRITQLIKYTDFLIARKLDFEKSNSLLRSHLNSANRELDEIFCVT
ncbi:MAG: cyclic nucleotide-binding domain-containing protein [Desulfobulbaceae bacterium]|nr:cyclic nucleotide-binding domain-containing protein [Desulfobulbaceae bacterium]